MKQEIKLRKKCRRDLLKKANVVGVGIGFREKGGVRTGEEAIVVYVTRKMPRQELNGAELVPRSLQGRQVDVIEIGEVRLLEKAEEPEPDQISMDAGRLARHRPAPGGVSIGHYKITAGTLGAVVRDRETGARLVLSNNHVLANASSGRDGRAAPGDPVLQPGAYDGGKITRDVIGRLLRFVPLQRTFQQSQCAAALFWERLANSLLTVAAPRYRITLQRAADTGNLVDAALAKPERESDLLDQILGLGSVTGTASARLGQAIAFSGRTSGVVRGKIIARDVGLNITMGPGEVVYFEDQLITTAVSQPGDSGSLLVDEQNRAVGLLFAGSERVSVCNRIDHVLRLLGVAFA